MSEVQHTERRFTALAKVSAIGAAAAALLTLFFWGATPIGAQVVPEGTATLGSDPDAREHNPVFGLGPQTIWKGGMGPGIDLELSRHVNPETGESEEELGVHGHFDYGVTQDLTLQVAIPLAVRKREIRITPGVGQVARDATGIGDAVVRAKWRVWHAFEGSTQYHASLFGGVKLPVARSTGEPALGSGSTDFIGAGAISRDGLRYYLWASALAKVNGTAFDRKRGNEFRYDAAAGFRPWVPEFTGLDPLFLLELNGVTAQENVAGGEALPETGGTILAVSPSFWLTYRNIAFKGGVKLPVYQELGTEEMELDYTLAFEIELHFGG